MPHVTTILWIHSNISIISAVNFRREIIMSVVHVHVCTCTSFSVSSLNACPCTFRVMVALIIVHLYSMASLAVSVH